MNSFPTQKYLIGATIVAAFSAIVIWVLTDKEKPKWKPIAAGAGTELLEVQAPQSHWTEENGFVEMVSPIRLPSTQNDRSRIQVFLKLPRGSIIDVIPSDGERGPLLRHPDGTRADRVESKLVYTNDGTRWTIADVRGGEIHGGRQDFHVMRPAKAGANSALFGYRWKKGDQAANQQAHGAIIEAMANFGAGFVYSSSARRLPKKIESFKSFSACASCHEEARPLRRRIHEPSPFRGSDASGYFGVQTVLENEGPLEMYRPKEVNHESPYVSIFCPSGAQPERISNQKGAVRFACQDGEIPQARFDMAAAVSDGDPHAKRVCRSRRYLHAHLRENARERFAKRFGECGI